MGKGQTDILNRIESLDIQKPSDVVLEKIRGLIMDGILNPGDQLPPERNLAEKFDVGRGHVREAIKKLEFYGIVKTYPQSGTKVASQGAPLLENMIANIIKLDKNDEASLMETRDILEINAARLMALRANNEQISILEKALMEHRRAIENGNSGINEDLVFHLKIAEYSNNQILQNMIMLITPEVHRLSVRGDSCRDGRADDAWLEHKKIWEAITRHDREAAGEAMKYHLQKSRQSYNR
jgi:GntR family transcriptional regulator, transcriptional repressor for pyruvate dehydrogenase complex